MKNEELTSEVQKLRTLLGSGMLQHQRVMSQHIDDGSRGQCSHYFYASSTKIDGTRGICMLSGCPSFYRCIRACVYVPRQRHSLTDLLSGFSYTCDWQLLHLLYVSVVNICSSDICQC